MSSGSNSSGNSKDSNHRGGGDQPPRPAKRARNEAAVAAQDDGAPPPPCHETAAAAAPAAAAAAAAAKNMDESSPPRTEVNEVSAQVQLLNAELAEKDKALAEKQKALAAKDKALAASDKALKQWERSAERRSLRTLLALKENEFALQRIGTDKSHTRGTRTGASAEEKPFQLIDFGDQTAANEKIPLDSNSKILLSLVGKEESTDCLPPSFRPLRYYSEADVATYVGDVLHDAMSVASYLFPEEITSELHMHKERSLFSYRPDIWVVRSEHHRFPLVVAEIKKPIAEGSLCDRPKPLGQAFDYAESLRACGHPQPVVVLTTLEESIVCWNQYEKDSQTTTEDRYADSLDITATSGPTPEKQKANSKLASATPPKLQTSDSARTVSSDGLDTNTSNFKPASERNFYRSPVFKAHQLVHTLCTVLCHSARAVPMMPKEERIYNLKQGKLYHFTNVLRFTKNKNTYTWGSLTVRLGTPIRSGGPESTLDERDESDKSDAESEHSVDDTGAISFYLIGKLGHGATSNVWHALNSQGHEVVIKMYVKTTDDKTDCILDAKGFEKQAKNATKKEVEKLKSFYQFSSDEVYQARLGGLYCVVMPFFCPVPKGERSKVLDKVKSVLENIFAQKKLMYHEEDVRWRHVGTYVDASQADAAMEPRLVLYDLADLVGAGSDSSWVQRHLDILSNHMGGELQTKPEQFVCSEVADDAKESYECKGTSE